VVCPQGERPATVRALFHSSTVDRASTGCLLEQARKAQRCKRGVHVAVGSLMSRHKQPLHDVSE
jgi:hypothetical protein